MITHVTFCHPAGSFAVLIDGYTHNSTFSSGTIVPLGKQFVLICQVTNGTPFNYTWTCPNGACEVEGYYGRKIYNEHILAVNTTSTSDGGTYTCQVTATGGQEATGNFTLTVTGMPLYSIYYSVIGIPLYFTLYIFRWSCCPQLWAAHTS